jgi:hypothetical protein
LIPAIDKEKPGHLIPARESSSFGIQNAIPEVLEQVLNACDARQGGMGKVPITSVCREQSGSALVIATREGDVRAFESLISRYDARIFAVAFRISRDRENAEDLEQQSFHKLLCILIHSRKTRLFQRG